MSSIEPSTFNKMNFWEELEQFTVNELQTNELQTNELQTNELQTNGSNKRKHSMDDSGYMDGTKKLLRYDKFFPSDTSNNSNHYTGDLPASPPTVYTSPNNSTPLYKKDVTNISMTDSTDDHQLLNNSEQQDKSKAHVANMDTSADDPQLLNGSEKPGTSETHDAQGSNNPSSTEISNFLNFKDSLQEIFKLRPLCRGDDPKKQGKAIPLKEFTRSKTVREQLNNNPLIPSDFVITKELSTKSENFVLKLKPKKDFIPDFRKLLNSMAVCLLRITCCSRLIESLNIGSMDISQNYVCYKRVLKYLSQLNIKNNRKTLAEILTSFDPNIKWEKSITMYVLWSTRRRQNAKTPDHIEQPGTSDAHDVQGGSNSNDSSSTKTSDFQSFRTTIQKYLNYASMGLPQNSSTVNKTIKKNLAMSNVGLRKLLNANPLIPENYATTTEISDKFTRFFQIIKQDKLTKPKDSYFRKLLNSIAILLYGFPNASSLIGAMKSNSVDISLNYVAYRKTIGPLKQLIHIENHKLLADTLSSFDPTIEWETLITVYVQSRLSRLYTIS